MGVRITQRTADKYERLLRYLKQYLAQRGKAEDIPVERMNYEFLDGFNLFLQTAHRCRHNGAVAVMNCLRTDESRQTGCGGDFADQHGL